MTDTPSPADIMVALAAVAGVPSVYSHWPLDSVEGGVEDGADVVAAAVVPMAAAGAVYVTGLKEVVSATVTCTPPVSAVREARYLPAVGTAIGVPITDFTQKVDPSHSHPAAVGYDFSMPAIVVNGTAATAQLARSLPGAS